VLEEAIKMKNMKKSKSKSKSHACTSICDADLVDHKTQNTSTMIINLSNKASQTKEM